MSRRSRGLVDRGTRRLSTEGETSRCAGELSPEKRRIAEALAALLVAHYRREQKEGERERIPVA